MNVQAVLEDLWYHPESEEQLRLAALELGAALPGLSDRELAQLDTGLARLDAAHRHVPPQVLGLREALLSVLSGAQQHRQRSRERHEREAELERALKPDWRRLLSAACKHDLFRPGELAREVGMQQAQACRNLADLVRAGLVERFKLQRVAASRHAGARPLAGDGRARLYRLTPEGLRLAQRLEVAEASSPTTASTRALPRLRLHSHSTP